MQEEFEQHVFDEFRRAHSGHGGEFLSGRPGLGGHWKKPVDAGLWTTHESRRGISRASDTCGLDCRAGIGQVVVGMAHQGYQVSLGEHGPARWITVFYRAREGHEPVAAAGTAQEATAWRAVQRAGWAAVGR
jgi:hypothetical protein